MCSKGLLGRAFRIVLMWSAWIAVPPALAGEGTALSHADLVDQATAQSRPAQTIAALPDGRIRMNVPMQDLQAEIGPHGLLLRSVDEGGSAALAQRVQAVGRENAMWLPRPANVQHDRERVYARQGILTQEYSANADGIRQDFILGAKPAGAGPLQLDLAFENASLEALPAASSAPESRTAKAHGSAQTPESRRSAPEPALEPSALPNLHDVIALHMDDGRVLHYHALHVTDADGQTLAARMTPLPRNRLRIEVQDDGARYPIRIDPTFTDADWTGIAEPGFNNTIRAVVVGAGKLYVGGDFTVANGGVLANRIAAWNGNTWSALGSGMNDDVYALAWDGARLYAGGSFITAGDTAAKSIAVWDGSAWSALRSGMVGSVYVLAWDGTRLYAGGGFTTAGGTAAKNIAVWDGSVWSALGLGTNGAVNALAWDDAAGRLYAGGMFSSAGGTTAHYIAVWDGSVWSALGSGMNGGVRALAWDGAQLYAGGGFNSAGGTAANRIAVWNGSAWSALGSGMESTVYALVWDGARLYAGGAFTTAGGSAAKNIAVWNGSAWSALGSGMNNDVYALTWDGAQVYAGGAFTTAGGSPAKNIAMWDGSAWSALGPGMDGTVYALAWDGAQLYAGGRFSTTGSTATNNIAMWDGSTWSALGSGMNNYVSALAWDGTAGRLYAGGAFTTPASYIAAWDGSTWSALGSGMNDDVYALAWDGAAHRLYAGGAFTMAGGQPAVIAYAQINEVFADGFEN